MPGGAVELGLGPLVAIGHSAGGHLALWLASEQLVSAAISLGGVSCLADAFVDRLGNDAAVEFMGSTPDESPAAYAHADPVQRLPTGVPTVLVHGARDEIVPVAQSRTYADALKAAGDDCELLEFRGGHFRRDRTVESTCGPQSPTGSRASVPNCRPNSGRVPCQTRVTGVQREWNVSVTSLLSETRYGHGRCQTRVRECDGSDAEVRRSVHRRDDAASARR